MISERINENSPWQDITEGNKIFEAATSRDFSTGEWRTSTPVWNEKKCRQCLLCTPVCPDSSIPVCDRKRKEFDYDHCKGCGICAKVCPFGAITMNSMSPDSTQDDLLMRSSRKSVFAAQCTGRANAELQKEGK